MPLSTYGSPSSSYAKELLHLGGASLGAGISAFLLSLVAPGHGGQLTMLCFGALVGLVANFRDTRSQTSPILRLMLGIGAGALLIILHTFGLPAWVVGGFLLGASWELEWHRGVGQRAALWATYGVVFAAGVFTSTTFVQTFGVGQVFPTAIFSTAIWGLFLMLPAWVKHQQDAGDAVLRDFELAAGRVERTQREHLEAAKRSYRRVKKEIDREEDLRTQERSLKIARDIAQGILDFSLRAHELREALSLTQERPLEGRARELEGRIRQTRDVGLKKELMAALAEVIEQLRVRRNLETACTRIEARQQRYLTALDRLHVTLVQNDAMSSAEGGGGEELVQSLASLEHLSEASKWASLSVEELCRIDLDQEEAFDHDRPQDLDPESHQQLQEMLTQLDELTHRPGASASLLPKPHLPQAAPPRCDPRRRLGLLRG